MNDLRINLNVILIIICSAGLLCSIQGGVEYLLFGWQSMEYLSRSIVLLVLGIEMILLGLLLAGIDGVKKYLQYREIHREFIKSWKEGMTEEDFRLNRVRIEIDKINEEIWNREYLCQPSFDEETDGHLGNGSKHGC